MGLINASKTSMKVHFLYRGYDLQNAAAVTW